MAMNYWHVRIEGAPGVEEIQSAVCRNGGLLLRISVEAGETSVYFAAYSSAAAKMSQAIKGAGSATEVHIDEVTRPG